MLKNKSKGITLISLVITVVVLLILAGVAVSITADEDGIFGKAGKASKETQIARDKDALQFAIIGSYVEEDLLSEEWSITEESGKITAISPTKNAFEVDENKQITYIEGGEVLAPGVSVEIARYLLGDDLQGRDMFDILVMEEVDGEAVYTFKQDSSNEESTTHETVYYLANEYDDETGTTNIAIMYNGDVYQFGVVEGTGASGIDTAKGSIQRLTNTPTELKEYFLGTDYKGRSLYDLVDARTWGFIPAEENPDSNLCMDLWFLSAENEPMIRYNQDVYFLAIEENNNMIQTKMLVFAYSLDGNVGKYVKYKDLMWIVFRDDSNGVELLSANLLGEVKLGGTTLEEAKEAYNSGITIINDKCKEETGITTNIRNIGGPAVDTAEIDETTGLKQPSTEYQSDIELMEQLGLQTARDNKFYWLGERKVVSEENFQICAYSPNDGYFAFNFMGTGYSSRVRPIISFEEGYLDQYTQKGTWDDPIKLD